MIVQFFRILRIWVIEYEHLQGPQLVGHTDLLELFPSLWLVRVTHDAAHPHDFGCSELASVHPCQSLVGDFAVTIQVQLI